jgi:hypothetical protein
MSTSAQDIHRTPPHSFDAEKGVLGSILQSSGDVIPECAEKISEEYFYVPAHRTIYRVLVDLWDAGQAIDLITFTEVLRDRNLLESVGGPAFVTELFTFVPTAANVQYYLDIVRAKYISREIIRAATESVRHAYEEQDEGNDRLLAELESRLVSIRSLQGRNGSGARTLDQFVVDPKTNGGNLLGNRWLCRNGGLLFAAPTGIGKTTFVLQASIKWSLGLDHFGIKPSGKLRVLIIQAENDDGDIAEIRDGIFRGLDLSKEHQASACAAIQVVCESSATGETFVALVARLVAEHKPDLLVIDPLFAYLGDAVNEQKAVSTFLRNGLNPILREHGCGLILVHHTNKPKTGQEKPDWRAGDFAYLGAGTAELANWARAVMVIRSLGSHTIFAVELGKRGRRAGLVSDDGKPLYRFCIKHSERGICWEAATDDDFVAPGKPPPKSADDLYRLFPVKGAISQGRLFESAKAAGIGKHLVRDLLDELIEQKRVFIWLKPRPGTRPAKSYSRQEQDLLSK